MCLLDIQLIKLIDIISRHILVEVCLKIAVGYTKEMYLQPGDMSVGTIHMQIIVKVMTSPSKSEQKEKSRVLRYFNA